MRAGPDDLAGEEGWLRVAQLAELGVLTASLLHELRQPLFAIRATAQLRRAEGRGLDGADLTELLGHLRHVDALLDHYTGFARMGGRHEPFDARVPAQHAAAMIEHRCRQEGVSLELDLALDAVVVEGRSTAVRQILVNLLQNALDAVADADGGPPTVRLAVRIVDGAAVLDVSDSGPGVPKDRRPELFRPFFTTKPEGRGTGLGLYIARRLAAELGGDVALRDAPSGTCVRLTLPLRAPGEG